MKKQTLLSLQSSLKWHSLSSRQAFWFCFTVEVTCCLLPAEGAHNVPLSTWSFLELLLLHSFLLTWSHIHPSSLMPSPFCSCSVQSHKHSKTFCSRVMYRAWCAHWCPLQLKHTQSFPSPATLPNGTKSSIQLFTWEIHSLLLYTLQVYNYWL